MKKEDHFSKMHIVLSLTFILLASANCISANEIPAISIVSDSRPGVSVLHGLTKLTNALQAKKFTFEKVGSISEAKGKLIIVTGLSSGDGEAAKILKAGNHVIPKVSEALTIWKTKWQTKPVWVISGFDDRGLMYGLLDLAVQIGWSSDKKNPLG
jgi:hypothetical protein